jgi:hypothetical protein
LRLAFDMSKKSMTYYDQQRIHKKLCDFFQHKHFVWISQKFVRF